MITFRVLVVEDSLTVRRRLIEVLEADPDIVVVGEAAEGQRAVELCSRLRPDVITLDMFLSGMDGLQATEQIMAYCPTPILVVSSSTNRGDLFKTYDALAAGAVDVMEKPLGDVFDDGWDRRFVSTVKVVARIKVITHLRAKLRTRGIPPTMAAASPQQSPGGPTKPVCVAIGASTGGPAALREILGGLSAGFPLPILLVIHIGSPFGTALAEWLDAQSPLRVACAVDGEPFPPRGQAKVILAPPERHLVLSDGRLRLTADPERHSCRPSVDVLFASVARALGGSAVACLLTGMGQDGAEGLLAVQRAGGLTLAQDEATSVVFGMPREAIRLGAAHRVLPLSEIAPTLRALAGDAEGGRGQS
jgi:two-component system chemotaxis response regulator CheB